MKIAQTILQQLGGSRLTVMTGARNFITHPNALSFRLPSTPHFVKNGINYVKVTLNSRDLYDIEFGRIHGLKYTVKFNLNDAYAEDLCRIFSDTTGLALTL